MGGKNKVKIGDTITVPTGPFANQLGEVLEILSREAIVQVGIGNAGRVRIPLDMLLAAETAEEETDNKLSAKTGRRERETNTNTTEPTQPTPRYRKTPVPIKASPPPPAKLTPTATTAPQIVEQVKKEEQKVTIQNTTTQAPARVEPVYCPICGNVRHKATDIVCGNCYRTYTNEAAIALAKGGFVNVFEWTMAKITGLLPGLEEQFTAAKAEVDNLQNVVANEAYATLKRNSGGREVPREIWVTALRNEKANLWRSRGGNIKFAKMKGFESRIVLIKAIIAKANEPKPAPATPPAPEVATPAPAEVVAPTAPEAKVAKTPRKRTVKAAAKAG